MPFAPLADAFQVALVHVDLFLRLAALHLLPEPIPQSVDVVIDGQHRPTGRAASRTHSAVLSFGPALQFNLSS